MFGQQIDSGLVKLSPNESEDHITIRKILIEIKSTLEDRLGKFDKALVSFNRLKEIDSNSKEKSVSKSSRIQRPRDDSRTIHV